MNLMKARTFDSSFLANITLTKLQNSGIECYLFDEHTVAMNPIFGNVIGGIKLMVKEEDIEETTQLLQQFDEEYLKSVVCPACGRPEISFVLKQGATNFITAILTWSFSSYALAPQSIYQCGHCKYESKTLPASIGEEDLHE
jgi:Putative prokaryotic signal transducing protein